MQGRKSNCKPHGKRKWVLRFYLSGFFCVCLSYPACLLAVSVVSTFRGHWSAYCQNIESRPIILCNLVAACRPTSRDLEKVRYNGGTLYPNRTIFQVKSSQIICYCYRSKMYIYTMNIQSYRIWIVDHNILM